ncbi:hypothetical protein BED46_026155 [Burkholderia contaminans]|jgi:hypothetical protein|nr:hypothetical protein WR31_24020 [Burkholderia contaminans LMG 23361]MBA9833722.1 hypothetical protein [Burkholderia contaminans]ONU62897.1 hypothetical protein A8E62_13910 [Burkholderia cenocepacia]MBA9841994.1 hypothetical protein [Burkholderia contaminans]MBA9866852.1 hypothetical protein [Burkholderia contaminans]
MTMKQETDAPKRDLTNPEYVAELTAGWQTAPVSMIVIEFKGTGDPFFGGSADDRTLGVDGLVRTPGSTIATATFTSIQDAHEAALRVTNRRPGSILGVAPTWR